MDALGHSQGGSAGGGGGGGKGVKSIASSTMRSREAKLNSEERGDAHGQ